MNLKDGARAKKIWGLEAKLTFSGIISISFFKKIFILNIRIYLIIFNYLKSLKVVLFGVVLQNLTLLLGELMLNGIFVPTNLGDLTLSALELTSKIETI